MGPSCTDRRAVRVLRCLLLAATLSAGAAAANNIGENSAWGFQSVQERALRQSATDMAERRKGGYYEAARTHITNNTWIERQVNCSQSATAAGNTGTNGMTAHTSSPIATSSTGISAGSTANSASNGSDMGGAGIRNGQANSGNLDASVSGSYAYGSTGAINAGGGHTYQALNSTQNNAGAQTASLSNSTACAGVIR
jgi:hypothetical protein